MVSGIRIYVEGGGNRSEGKILIRQGFHSFLRKLIDLARSKRVGFAIVACGSRQDAYDNFRRALQAHPNAFNVLLVDSEGPVDPQHLPWEHLLLRDSWQRPTGCPDEHCHLMVQTMEYWLVIDRDALKRFYGQGFHEGSLPNTADVEQIDRRQLESALEKATRLSEKKGVYHKVQHGPRLLELIDVTKVCDAAPYCKRLVEILQIKISE